MYLCLRVWINSHRAPATAAGALGACVRVIAAVYIMLVKGTFSYDLTYGLLSGPLLRTTGPVRSAIRQVMLPTVNNPLEARSKYELK